MQLKDIPNDLVLRLAATYQAKVNGPVLDSLVALGYPEKLAFRKIEQLCDRGFLEYGVSARYAWPTPEGLELLKKEKASHETA